MWEEINRLFLDGAAAGARAEWTAGTHEFLTATVSGVHQFQGVTDATMTHGEGWHFMELGRFLERASATAALLEVQYRECEWSADQAPGVSEYVEWVGLLKSCCAFEAYCRHYTADVRPRRIAEFLVLNADFPRSIHSRRRTHPGVAARARRDDRARQRPRRSAGRPAVRLARLRADGRNHRRPAGLSSRHRPPGHPDQHRRAPAVRRLSDRHGPGGIWSPPHDHALRHPPHHPLHLHVAGQRERDGAADAAGHRRAAALPAVRGRGRSRGRACSPIATSSATGSTTSTSPAGTRSWRSPPARRCRSTRRRRCRAAARRRGLGVVDGWRDPASTGTSASRATSPPGRRR